MNELSLLQHSAAPAGHFFGSRSAASSAEIIRKQDLVPSSLKKSYLLNRREIWVIVIFIKMKYRRNVKKKKKKLAFKSFILLNASQKQLFQFKFSL